MPVRRRYHFHSPGLVYVFITLLTALGAFNSQNNLLFWAFGFALAILIVSGLISGQMLMGIRAERTAAPRAVVGEPVTLSYRISNRSRMMPAFAIGATEFAVGDEPAAATGGARDRGRAHAARLVPRSTAATLAYTFLVHLGPRESIDLAARLTPARRGTLRLSDFSLETSFPFGIIRKSLLFRQPRTILVHPRPIAPPAGLLRRRRALGQNSSPRATRTGAGEEYFALREYLPGDSPRSIAWRATARSDTVMVRQNSQPVPQRLLVLLRLDPTLSEDANESAIGLAAGVISSAAEAGYEIGLVAPNAALDRRPAPGRAYATKLLDDLALISLADGPGTRGAPVRVPAAVSRGTLVVAVHAGPADSSFGPPGTTHLSVSSAAPRPAPAPSSASATRPTTARRAGGVVRP